MNNPQNVSHSQKLCDGYNANMYVASSLMLMISFGIEA
jgi:hypothetical protein